MSGELKPVGNWKGEIQALMKDALAVSMEVIGRNGENAVRHAIILMAQSARKMTKQAKKNRKLQRDESKRPFVWKYGKGGKRKWYLPRKKERPGEYATMLAKLRPIRGRGLAKRSWMWGLRGLKGAPIEARRSKAMTGITYLRKILGEKASGYVMTNSLSYLLKIMPAGWKASVVRKAANRIMAQAKRKVERDWKRGIEGRRPAGAVVPPGLSKYFLRS